MTITEQSIKQSLSRIELPELGKDLVSANWVKSIDISEAGVSIKLMAGFPCEQQKKHYLALIAEQLNTDLNCQADVELSWQVAAHAHKAGVKSLSGVKNIIAVASGKGGVGKSTTSANLALALLAEGASVGLLDADIYGPSQPIMMGMKDSRPETIDQKRILPVKTHGVQTMSIGYLIDPEQAMVWRGPMASGALQQLINDTQWQDLDYLIVDLPPGTGDIQLTLSQKVPVTASVIVTTPQDLALADAVKAISMFEKVSVPVLGVVENMGMHICSNCGHQEHIFGEGGGSNLASDSHVEFLGSLPLTKQIRDDSDKGKPSVVADPEGDVASIYRTIARTMSARLSLLSKDYGQSFPKISITND